MSIQESEIPSVACQCGEHRGDRCSWSGPQSETVLVEYMPAQHRGSHRAAGNRGTYPANGAVLIRVSAECGDAMVEHDGEWCSIMADAGSPV